MCICSQIIEIVLFMCRYYFPTYEDDTLLCLLDDRVAGEQAPVIPEECSVRDSILQDEELKRNLML